MLAQRLAHPCPLIGSRRAEAREQLALALDGKAGDDPALGEALEEELDGPLPGVLLGEEVAGEDRGVLAPRPRCSEPRSVRTLPSGSVYSLLGALSLAGF